MHNGTEHYLLYAVVRQPNGLPTSAFVQKTLQLHSIESDISDTIVNLNWHAKLIGFILRKKK